MSRAMAGGRGGLWCVVMCLALVGCDEGSSDNIGAPVDPDDGVLDPGDLAVDPDRGQADGAPSDMGPAGADAGPVGPVEVEPCIATVTIGDLEIFAFEASRFDATADSAGFDESAGICSQAGVLPWTGLTWPDANRVCVSHGFQLCTDEQWQTACSGVERLWSFPYAQTHRPAVCNEHVSGSGAVEPTGSRADCRTPEGVFDMSGNVWELTADGSKRGASWKLNASMFRVDAARCDMYYDVIEGFADDDVGFRCCR